MYQKMYKSYVLSVRTLKGIVGKNVIKKTFFPNLFTFSVYINA